MLKTGYAILFWGFVFGGVFGTAAPVLAAANISARPAHPAAENRESEHWFFFTLARGDQQTDAIVLENTGSEEQKVLLYPADKTPSTDEGFALKQRAEDMTVVGAWIALDQSEVVLAPGERRTIDFVVDVPKDTAPGEYAGAIMVEPIGDNAIYEMKDSGIRFNMRYGTRVYLTVTDTPVTSSWMFWISAIGGIMAAVMMARQWFGRHHRT